MVVTSDLHDESMTEFLQDKEKAFILWFEADNQQLITP